MGNPGLSFPAARSRVCTLTHEARPGAGLGSAMAVSSARRTAEPESPPGRLALAVADANWFTTENLFQELDRPGIATLLLKCIDYFNAWKQGGTPWGWGRALTERAPNLWQRDLVLPSGWMKQFPSWGMRPIRRSIAAMARAARPRRPAHAGDDLPALSLPARPGPARPPRLLQHRRLLAILAPLRRPRERAGTPGGARVRPHGLRVAAAIGSAPRGRARGRSQDPPPPSRRALAVARAPGTSHPGRAAERHSPTCPARCFGYVGSLEDRIDWPLLTKLADAFPHGSIVLIGNPDAATTPGAWQLDRKRCLARPNVQALGWRPQETIARYNASFDVCLIPYRADHPFNQVCCPTKIMDYMGTGRPIVATDLPECRLYEDLFDVATDGEQFLEFGQEPRTPQVRRWPRRSAIRVRLAEHLPPRGRAIPRLAARLTTA